MKQNTPLAQPSFVTIKVVCLYAEVGNAFERGKLRLVYGTVVLQSIASLYGFTV